MSSEEQGECPTCLGWAYENYTSDKFCQTCCGSGILPVVHFFEAQKCSRCGINKTTSEQS